MHGRAGEVYETMAYLRDSGGGRLMALKARKAELFAGVMDDGNAFAAGLGADDIRGLFA